MVHISPIHHPAGQTLQKSGELQRLLNGPRTFRQQLSGLLYLLLLWSLNSILKIYFLFPLPSPATILCLPYRQCANEEHSLFVWKRDYSAELSVLCYWPRIFLSEEIRPDKVFLHPARRLAHTHTHTPPRTFTIAFGSGVSKDQFDEAHPPSREETHAQQGALAFGRTAGWRGPFLSSFLSAVHTQQMGPIICQFWETGGEGTVRDALASLKRFRFCSEFMTRNGTTRITNRLSG